jgi:hypothetical protein
VCLLAAVLDLWSIPWKLAPILLIGFGLVLLFSIFRGGPAGKLK